jgi:hypothetical protein
LCLPIRGSAQRTTTDTHAKVETVVKVNAFLLLFGWGRWRRWRRCCVHAVAVTRRRWRWHVVDLGSGLSGLGDDDWWCALGGLGNDHRRWLSGLSDDDRGWLSGLGHDRGSWLGRLGDDGGRRLSGLRFWLCKSDSTEGQG